MSLIVVDASKPKISIEDWFRNQRQKVQEYAELAELSYNTRFKSAELRDITSSETRANLELTQELLIERFKEITEWKELIGDCIRDLKNELKRLGYEKDLCSRDLQNLNPKFTILSECKTLRCGRVKTDLCLDLVDAELDKEHRLLEAWKKKLSDKCEEAFIQLTKANELLNILLIDYERKNEACAIEKCTLNLPDNNTSVSHKPEITRFIHYASYNSWLENCRHLQSQSLLELQKCIKLREEINHSRQLATSERLAQYDATNFALRKRIFETRYFMDELNWQKQMLQEEEQRVSVEVENLKKEWNNENETLKLFESQSRNRIYRENIELCNEKCTENLEVQVLQAKKRVEQLNQQLNLAMRTQNLLHQQTQRLEEEIKTKTCSVVTDSHCLEIRNDTTE